MKKAVIIINGVGGAGKDTLCDLSAKHFPVKNVSSITPIKEIASANGWNGEKDAKSRKFLADLKKLFTEYNDLPTTYLYEQYEAFAKSEEEIMYAHIREGEEIDKFKNKVIEAGKANGSQIPCLTLLIDRPVGTQEKWGNSSDDDVKLYDYDLYFVNDKSLEEIEVEFVKFLEYRVFGDTKA